MEYDKKGRKREKVKKILVLGSGSLKIGEAGEFDYSGSHHESSQTPDIRPATCGCFFEHPKSRNRKHVGQSFQRVISRPLLPR